MTGGVLIGRYAAVSNVKADMKRLSANLLWVKPDDVGDFILIPANCTTCKKGEPWHSTTDKKFMKKCRGGGAIAQKVSKSRETRGEFDTPTYSLTYFGSFVLHAFSWGVRYSIEADFFPHPTTRLNDNGKEVYSSHWKHQWSKVFC